MWGRVRDSLGEDTHPGDQRELLLPSQHSEGRTRAHDAKHLGKYGEELPNDQPLWGSDLLIMVRRQVEVRQPLSDDVEGIRLFLEVGLGGCHRSFRGDS